MTPPRIDCRRIPATPTEDLLDVRAAFRHCSPCRLGQSWLPGPEPDFQPADVRTGWRGDELLVFAELTDLDIYNDAVRLNQKTWELGDVLEIFLRPLEQETYVEFHITPNNQRLQLRIPSTAAIRSAQKSGMFDSFLLPGEVIRSNVWIEPGKWSAFVRLPAEVVCATAKALPGSEWRFSFSRYDYTRARKGPVISSTSPHPVADFHSQAEWGTLKFR